MNNEQYTLRGERAYTIKLTILCLVIGIPLAAACGLLLYSLNQPVTQVGGTVRFSFNSLGLPLAFVVSLLVFALTIFWLPVRIARRAGRILDPHIYPMMGVISVAVLLVAAFVLAITLNII